MRLANLVPTDRIEQIDGAPARLWTGETDKGVPVHVYVRCISPQTHDEAINAEFERELLSLPEPRRSVIVTDMRFVLD